MATFKGGVLGVAAIAGLVSLGVPASASTVFDLNIISTANPPIANPGTLLGTVTLDQIGLNEVDVTVALINAAFVSTGGPHNAFAYNLDLLTPYTVAITSPASGFQVGPAGDNTPFGSFTNTITCPGCGPGASNANPGPLKFSVTDLFGISIGDFTANIGGYFFSADVQGPLGGTGNIASNGLTQTPLPAALPLFASGLGGMGLFGWWRKRKTKAVTTPA